MLLGHNMGIILSKERHLQQLNFLLQIDMCEKWELLFQVCVDLEKFCFLLCMHVNFIEQLKPPK